MLVMLVVVALDFRTVIKKHNLLRMHLRVLLPLRITLSTSKYGFSKVPVVGFAPPQSNTWFRWPHESPYPKRHFCRFIRFCEACDRQQLHRQKNKHGHTHVRIGLVSGRGRWAGGLFPQILDYRQHFF